jgi:predicted ribosomally synthesized peptide with nif11-like leader
MSVESAKAYIERMRSDAAFRSTVNACDDEQANWRFLKENGFEFTLEEFKQAQALIYEEHGITPL